MFGSLMGDLEDDPIFGSHMHSMRQMNSMMNSIFNGDPFGGLFGGGGGFDNMLTAAPHFGGRMVPHQNHHNAMMPFGFMPPMARMGFMPQMMPDPARASFTSTSYVSMSAGPDGRQQIYQASSSTKTGPHGVMETKKTVQDSRTGIKKMAIGHHIGERGHIIEREQNYREGTEEERQDFINLEEEEADDFNREFLSKARPNHSGPSIQCIETGPLTRPAIMPAQPAQAPIRRTEEEPIIELPESPSPPPEQSQSDEEEEEEVVAQSKQVEEGAGCSSSSKSGRSNLVRSPNVLGVQPRKPIRTHQASPLATMGRQQGHSIRSAGHPYNPQQSRKAHRPMKGTGHYQQNNYPHNSQYERHN